MEDREVRLLVARTETLLAEVEGLQDPKVQSVGLDTIQAFFQLYGEGLRRMVKLSAQGDEKGLLDSFKGDELVSHLLLMHDLHPETVESRVLQALEEVRPYMESHGGN